MIFFRFMMGFCIFWWILYYSCSAKGKGRAKSPKCGLPDFRNPRDRKISNSLILAECIPVVFLVTPAAQSGLSRYFCAQESSPTTPTRPPAAVSPAQRADKARISGKSWIVKNLEISDLAISPNPANHSSVISLLPLPLAVAKKAFNSSKNAKSQKFHKPFIFFDNVGKKRFWVQKLIFRCSDIPFSRFCIFEVRDFSVPTPTSTQSVHTVDRPPHANGPPEAVRVSWEFYRYSTLSPDVQWAIPGAYTDHGDVQGGGLPVGLFFLMSRSIQLPTLWARPHLLGTTHSTTSCELPV